MSFPAAIGGELVNKIVEKLSEEFGAQALELAGHALEHAVEEFGPELLQQASKAGGAIYTAVAPSASSVLNAASQATGITGSKFVGGLAGFKAETMIQGMLEDGPLAEDMARLGEQLRSAAGRGAEHLQHLTDAQLGMLAVLAAQAPDLRERFQSRVNRMLRRRP